MALMTRAEAIDYLGISERTMCALTANREIAYIQHKPGGKMFFREQDLESYIDRKRVAPIPELARSLPAGATYRRRRVV